MMAQHPPSEPGPSSWQSASSYPSSSISSPWPTSNETPPTLAGRKRRSSISSSDLAPSPPPVEDSSHSNDPATTPTPLKRRKIHRIPGSSSGSQPIDDRHSLTPTRPRIRNGSYQGVPGRPWTSQQHGVQEHQPPHVYYPSSISEPASSHASSDTESVMALDEDIPYIPQSADPSTWRRPTSPISRRTMRDWSNFSSSGASSANTSDVEPEPELEPDPDDVVDRMVFDAVMQKRKAEKEGIAIPAGLEDFLKRMNPFRGGGGSFLPRMGEPVEERGLVLYKPVTRWTFGGRPSEVEEPDEVEPETGVREEVKVEDLGNGPWTNSNASVSNQPSTGGEMMDLD